MKTRVVALLLVAATSVIGGCSTAADSTEAVRRGDAFLKEGKVREALIEFQRAVQANERDGVARRKLGQTFGALGEAQRATDQLVRAADLLSADAEAQLDAANALLAVGQYEDAGTRATGVLKADPRNVRAHVLRAAATAGMKDLDGALESLKEAAKLDPGRSSTFVDLAAVELTQGKRTEAEAGFKQAMSVAPKSAEPRLALAGFYWSTNRRAEAEAMLEGVIGLEPNNAPANLALAGLYRGTGRAPLAEAPLKRLADSSDDPGAKLALADYYIAEKRVGEARTILAALSNQPGATAAAQARLAAVEYDAGKRDTAYKMLEAILAKEPTNADIMVVRGGWLLREGKYADANAAAIKATQADPKLADAFSLLGSVQALQNNPEEAIKSHTEVLRLRPNAVVTQVTLTGLHLAMGRTTEAGQFARQAKALAPTVAGPRHALARVLFAEGRLDDADRELQPVLAAAPNSADALGLRGLIRQRRGDAAGARKDFQQVLDSDPKSVEALAGLTTLDLAAKRPGDAAKRLAAATAEAPTDARILVLAGRAQLASGDLSAAESSFQKALQADPSVMEAYDALGQLFVRQNRLEEARQAYDKRTKERPNDVAAHTMVARILYVQGKPAESRARFEKILAIDPRAAVASNNLAYMDADAGTNLDVALNRAQVAKAALPDDPDINDTLGWVYVKRGLPALAVSPLEQAIQKDPKNPLYHYHLGMAHEAGGDKDRARLSLQRSLQISKAFEGAADAQRALDALGR